MRGQAMRGTAGGIQAGGGERQHVLIHTGRLTQARAGADGLDVQNFAANASPFMLTLAELRGDSTPAAEAGAMQPWGFTMKLRIALAGGLLLALSGCATYDYAGGGSSGGYYTGQPSVQYNYPAGYPGYNGGGYYGYGGGYGGYYPGGYYRPGYGYGYPVVRPPHNHRPPRPPGNRPPPTRPPENRPPPRNNGGSPWRNMDSNTRPQRPPQAGPRPQVQPQRQAAPRPQSAPRPQGSPARNLNRYTERRDER